MKPLYTPLIIITLLLTPALQAGSLEESLSGKLVHLEGDELKKADASAMEGKDIVAVYYSAHWCPPCRAFTPELSKFYKKAAKKYSNFQLIFVSSDKNEEAMAEYMDWGKMKFLAVDYSQRKSSGLSKHAARGIPYMVVLDGDGKVLLEKPKGKDWVHPSAILEQLDDLLKEKGKKA
jgi:nucleoredoxin